jgi:hypothetical protein
LPPSSSFLPQAVCWDYLSCFQVLILRFNFRVCGNLLVLLNGNAQS